MSAVGNTSTRTGTTGGYRIGRYRVRARLGKGGMGVVYLGRDEALDRDVAIKTLRVDGSPDDESRGRFEIEAKAAARLQHPNIVTVFELGEDRGLPFIAMELLGGQDLETLIRSGEKLSTLERLDVVIQTLRGLDFAHAHHIVHRDMKPSNIRVLDDGGVKILDFGIAKVESTSVTRAGMMVGTPHYMSPEHIRGGGLDGRSDVFALGVILHELFAMKRPFTAKDATQVMYRIVNDPHPKLQPDAAGPLTESIQQVIDKALEKDADARFSSAAQMADELARVRERQPAPHLRPDDARTLSQARKLLSSTGADASLAEAVEAIALANPEVTEAQRLLRVIKRKPLELQGTEDTASFPELDATFGRGEEPPTLVSGATVRGRAETVAQAAPSEVPPRSAEPSKAIVFGAIGITLATAMVAAFIYVSRPEAPSTSGSGGTVPVDQPTPSTPPVTAPENGLKKPTTAAAATPSTPARPAAPSPRATLEIRSQPSGATVRVDRKSVGATPLKSEIVAGASHVVTLSLAGYETKEIRVEPPFPPLLDVTLVAVGPPATLVVESPYPVTISTGGRVLAADKAGATLTLPAGSHDIVIESTAMFLKIHESVRLESGGSVSLKAPATGKIGVRANPDNCKVLVDGIFVDYPPILDRPIAAGSHVVSFEWPDGARSEEKVQIQAGKPSYVMGRKP